MRFISSVFVVDTLPVCVQLASALVVASAFSFQAISWVSQLITKSSICRGGKFS
jgi:hypothetical protein